MKSGNYEAPWGIVANPDQDVFKHEKTGKRGWWLHKGLKRKTVIFGITSLWKARRVILFFFFLSFLHSMSVYEKLKSDESLAITIELPMCRLFIVGLLVKSDLWA